MRLYIKFFICLAGMLVAVGAFGQTTTYVNESFTGSTAQDWTLAYGQGQGPILTGNGTIDNAGEGWLRLTQHEYDQSSFVYYNNPISTLEGLIFTFDFVLYGQHSNTLGDGFVLAIFDANTTPEAGAYGGSLGYAQRDDPVEGLAGGIVGIGFDVYGNYSRANEGRIGGGSRTQNSIAIRGSAGETRMEGYEYIVGTESLDAFSTTGTLDRDNATVHTVRITLPTDKNILIEWHDGDGEWETLIGPYQCDLNCPEEVMFGFTAGTGGARMVQEIRNLSVTNIPEPGSVLLLALAAGGGLWLRRRFVD